MSSSISNRARSTRSLADSMLSIKVVSRRSPLAALSRPSGCVGRSCSCSSAKSPSGAGTSCCVSTDQRLVPAVTFSSGCWWLSQSNESVSCKLSWLPLLTSVETRGWFRLGRNRPRLSRRLPDLVLVQCLAFRCCGFDTTSTAVSLPLPSSSVVNSPGSSQPELYP